MSANFTPTQGNYDSPAPFKAWSHMVLPSVFDDSLSYYETLTKLTGYINKLLNIHANMGTDITNLFNAYNQLQSYCNEYFSNMDVQKEINQKLDAMSKDGTLTLLIGEYVAPLYVDQSTRISALESRVNNLTKLGEGSTTGDAELMDVRIGYAGKPYVTAGDAVRGQVDDLNVGQFSLELNSSNVEIEIGKTVNETGTMNTNAPTYCVTPYIRVYGGEQVTTTCYKDGNDVVFNMYVNEYADNAVSFFIKRTPIVRGSCVVLSANCKYIKISFGRSKTTGINFTESDLTYFQASIRNLYTRFAEMLDNTMYHRELATAENSMDDLTHFGVYGWSSSDRPYDCPFADGGVMLVCQQVMTNNPAHGRLVQIVVTSLGVATRYRQTTRFTPWLLPNKVATQDSVKLDALVYKNLTPYKPLKTIPSSKADAAPFEAGKEYRGIPYSSVHYVSNDVYFNRSIETLLSAFNNKDSAVYNYANKLANTSGVWCGGVCSSYVSWALSLPIYYTTYDLAKLLDYKKIKCIEDVEIGDVLICHTKFDRPSTGDHAMLVTGLVPGDSGVVGVEISEQWIPMFRKLVYDKSKFMGLLDGTTRRGQYYYVGKLKDTILGYHPQKGIRTIPDIKVNTDIISEFGDNTYFEAGEPVYIQSKNSVITVRPPNSVDTYDIDLSTLGKKAGTDMYNITSIVNETLGKWTLYSSTGEESHVTIVNLGVIEVENVGSIAGKIRYTCDGYYGCEPVGYAVVGVFKGTGFYYDTHMSDPAYVAGRLTIHSATDPKYARGSDYTNTIDLYDANAKYEYFYVRVFYDTGCGQAYKDSALIKRTW